MTETLLDESVAAGATTTASHRPPSPTVGWETVYYVRGDANATDVNLTWRAAPQDGGEFHLAPGGDAELANVDITGGLMLRQPVHGAGEVQVEVTNNAVSAAVITIQADESH